MDDSYPNDSYANVFTFNWEVETLFTMLASMSEGHDHGWFWFWPLVPLFWFLVFFVIVRLFFWRGRRGPWGYYSHRGPDARAILAERYARGEITHDEYRERLGHLEA